MQGRILNTSQFPDATFTLTKPIALGKEPSDGVEITTTATGNLTLHGTTKSVTITDMKGAATATRSRFRAACRSRSPTTASTIRVVARPKSATTGRWSFSSYCTPRRKRLNGAVDDRTVEAAALADALLRRAIANTTPAERRRSARLGRLLGNPGGRELLFTLTDEVLRAEDDIRAMRRLRALVADGLPRALGPVDRLGLQLAAYGSTLFPALVAKVVRARVKAETRGVILPATEPAFGRHIARRRAQGFDANVNRLGEAILGDDEADARLDAVCRLLQRTDVRCVSVKVSALCANLDVLAFEHSVARIAERLERVYRVAATASPSKFVYLDMEEYRDLHLTVVAFRTVLDHDEFIALSAGIALQAYVPDSYAVLDELCEWAADRRARGGAPVRVRIVKGANLAMEQVEAELMGWPQAPFTTKAEVDAHFKRMLDRALAAAARGDVRIGVASHNLFDVAWALHRRRERGLVDAVEIEMLEGMAPAQARDDARHRGCVAALFAGRRAVGVRSRNCATCRAGSTRTRRRRTSCAPCSRSRRDPGNGPRSARGSSKRSRLPTTCRPCRAAIKTGAVSNAASKMRPRSPTNPTPTSRCRETASGSPSISRRARRPNCRRSSRRPTVSTRSWSGRAAPVRPGPRRARAIDARWSPASPK